MNCVSTWIIAFCIMFVFFSGSIFNRIGLNVFHSSPEWSYGGIFVALWWRWTLMSIVFSEYSETVCACACSVCVAVWFCLLSVDFGEGLMASYNLNGLVYPRRVSYALIRLMCARKYSEFFNSSNSCAKILSDLAGVW